MSAAFVHAFQGEWLKRRRSLASWLVIAGSCFTPLIVIVARLVRPDGLARRYAADGFWLQLWRNSWESMAIFFLPMVAILAASLLAQVEFRNHAWKQVHALPLAPATIYFSKFAVLLLMMLQFFLLFDLAIYLSAIVPWLLVRGVPYPQDPVPWAYALREDLFYFVDCLPIVAAQFALSVRYGNFLVPVGVGFLAWVGALGALPWKYAYAIPYTYCMLNYLKDDASRKAAVPPEDFHAYAIAWFVVFTVVGYILFSRNRQKG